MSAMSNSNDASIRSRLAQTYAKLGLDLLDEQNEKLRKYLSQIQRWNKTYNLTAIRDEEQMLIQHMFNSLAAVAPLERILSAKDKQTAIYDCRLWRRFARRRLGHHAPELASKLY